MNDQEIHKDSREEIPDQTATSEEHRQGAEAGQPEDLPMVCWLTGCEPWAESFSLSADDAMKALGIKRSRLTQLSGKELRVGRIRSDRYIRPVYRPQDIETYLSWSRPTATHKNSSKVLGEAVSGLERLSNELQSRIEGIASGLSEDLVAQISDALLADIQQKINENNRLIADVNTSQLRGLESLIQQINGSVKKIIGTRLAPMIFQQTMMDKKLSHLENGLEKFQLELERIKSRLTEQDVVAKLQMDQTQLIGTRTLELSKEMEHWRNELRDSIEVRNREDSNAFMAEIEWLQGQAKAHRQEYERAINQSMDRKGIRPKRAPSLATRKTLQRLQERTKS